MHIFFNSLTATKKRDIETEEMLEELHGRIRELERENSATKEKVDWHITVLISYSYYNVYRTLPSYGHGKNKSII